MEEEQKAKEPENPAVVAEAAVAIAKHDGGIGTMRPRRWWQSSLAEL